MNSGFLNPPGDEAARPALFQSADELLADPKGLTDSWRDFAKSLPGDNIVFVRPSVMEKVIDALKKSGNTVDLFPAEPEQSERIETHLQMLRQLADSDCWNRVAITLSWTACESLLAVTHHQQFAATLMSDDTRFIKISLIHGQKLFEAQSEACKESAPLLTEVHISASDQGIILAKYVELAANQIAQAGLTTGKALVLEQEAKKVLTAVRETLKENGVKHDWYHPKLNNKGGYYALAHYILRCAWEHTKVELPNSNRYLLQVLGIDRSEKASPNCQAQKPCEVAPETSSFPQHNKPVA